MDESKYLKTNGILLAEFCIVTDGGGAPMRRNSKGILWSSPKPSLFMSRSSAERAIVNSLRYAAKARVNLHWQRDDYNIVKLYLATSKPELSG